MATALKNKVELKAFIVLYGVGDSGKTKTLNNLTESLCMASAPTQFHTGINQFFSKHKDFRMIVEYQGTFLYISTYGDTLEDTQENVAFFEGELRYTSIWLYRCGKNIAKLKDPDYLENLTPEFCISASRGDGRVPMPLQYYGVKMRNNCSSVVWLHKDRVQDKSSFPVANRTDASSIQELIDRKLNGKLI